VQKTPTPYRQGLFITFGKYFYQPLQFFVPKKHSKEVRRFIAGKNVEYDKSRRLAEIWQINSAVPSEPGSFNILPSDKSPGLLQSSLRDEGERL
jgi:hypothetical protein